MLYKMAADNREPPMLCGLHLHADDVNTIASVLSGDHNARTAQSGVVQLVPYSFCM